MTKAGRKLTYAVAVSGGADSLYSLIRLRAEVDARRVFALHALFLPEWLRPAAYRTVLDGLRENCARLGVELVVLDLSAAFERLVVRAFLRAYQGGLTPNPCANCNRDLKFGLLLDAAEKQGADRLVTGHYARLREQADGPVLLAGLDTGKDQSYFLALTPLERLAKARFPVGGLQKREVLAELAAGGIKVPQKGESQEICFVTDNDYRRFLREYAQRAGEELSGPGPVLLPDGRVIGRHQGLWAYTEGQRRGLGIAWSEPLYVLGKRAADNSLLVGVAADFSGRDCRCAQLNFFLPPSNWPETVYAKTRYRQKLQPVCADVAEEAGGPVLKLRFPGDADPPAAPGQVAAVYAPLDDACGSGKSGEPGPEMRLLAGGVILPNRL